jgi:hypothetical protein
MIELYQSFKNANAEVGERVLRVRYLWTRTKTQLEFVKSIESSLGAEHYAVQVETLNVLATKLNNVCARIGSFCHHGQASSQSHENEINRWKYAFFKSNLDKTIEELRVWQEVYDPTWYLVMRIADQVIDAQLSHVPVGKSNESVFVRMANVRDSLRAQPQRTTHIFLDPTGLDYSQTREISFSAVKLLPRLQSTKWFLVDSVPCNDGSDLDIKMKDIRELAVKLSNADPASFGMLSCRGVVKSCDTAGRLIALHLVFDIPEADHRITANSTNCFSLRGSLELSQSMNLTSRFDIARQVAKSISYVHMLGFVHKDVRAENFIAFESGLDGSGTFYLTGFERIRTADGRTYHHEDSAWYKAIYRHPSRQGSTPRQDYCMQHDIYSLGVCLLEIGLWDSLLTFDGRESVRISETYLGAGTDPLAMSASEMKDRIVTLARERLPFSMGTMYTWVVINCLTCLDPDNSDFGDRSEFEDAEGILVGVRYIQKVSHKLFRTLNQVCLKTNVA